MFEPLSMIIVSFSYPLLPEPPKQSPHLDPDRAIFQHPPHRLHIKQQATARKFISP
ncbi:hypothetical protein J3E68DRAFT_163175 [Trichoderma sp. SZMC 28012]